DAGDDQGFVFEGVSQRQGCEGQGVDTDEFEGDKEGLDAEGQGLEGQGYNGVEFEGDIEGQDCEGQGKGGQGQVYKESENMNVNESENIPVNESVNVNVNENESENLNVNESENLNVNESENVNVNVNCNESENITRGLRDKGKRKLYEQYLNESSSEFDDSFDEDYVQPIIDGDSNTLSLVLEDIEVESDDDIFSNKNPTKLELVKKLKKVMKESQKAKLKQKICDVREEDLASDYDDEEDLESLPGSEEEPQKKCPVFKDSTKYFWKAASTTNKQDFERYMKKIEEIDPKVSEDVETASEWLKKVNPEHWVRAFFPVHSKFDILVNNLCESFNSYILEARDKPIISMFEWIRTKLMMRLQQKREGMEKYAGTVCPNILKKIKKQQLLARNCFTRWCGANEFEVYHFLDKFVVDLDKKTYTCGMFQLNGYPCCHASAAIGTKRAKIDDFVEECYKKETYLRVYNEMIHVVPGVKDYLSTSFEPLKPPAMKKQRGRPKKLRRRGRDELSQSKVSTMKGLTHTCTKCLETGQNKNSCSNPINPRSKYFKRSLPEEIPQGSQAPPTSQEQATEQVRKRDPKVSYL
ncbi:UNVERIFIED_CONTAM: hypothetical protein Sradi_5829500, partial [Sesamum radiatum]